MVVFPQKILEYLLEIDTKLAFATKLAFDSQFIFLYLNLVEFLRIS